MHPQHLGMGVSKKKTERVSFFSGWNKLSFTAKGSCSSFEELHEGLNLLDPVKQRIEIPNSLRRSRTYLQRHA